MDVHLVQREGQRRSGGRAGRGVRHQDQRGLESRVQHAGRQDMSGALVVRARLFDPDEQFRLAQPEFGHAAHPGAVLEALLAQCGVRVRGIVRGGAGRAQRVEVEGRRLLGGVRLGGAPAVDDGRRVECRGARVHGERDGAVVVLPGEEAHLHLGGGVGHDQGAQPRDVAQADRRARTVAVAHGRHHRGTEHLHVRGGGQHAGAAYLVGGEEGLVAREGGGVALLEEAGGVAVEERVQRRARVRRAVLCGGPEPVAFAGERVDGQPYASRAGVLVLRGVPRRPVLVGAAFGPARGGLQESGRVVGRRPGAGVHGGVRERAGQEGVEGRGQFGAVAHQERDACGHRFAAGLQGVRDVGEPLCGAQRGGGVVPVLLLRRAQVAEEGAGDGAQPVGGLRGERYEVRAAGSGVRRVVGRGQVFLQHHVRVGAAEAEGADARAARRRAAVGRGWRRVPGLGVAHDAERAAVELDQLVLPGEVDRRGQRPAGEGADHLDHSGDARGAFEVPDVGLDRPDAAALRPRLGAVRGVQGAERPLERDHFDRVADRGARPVRLDVGHRVGADAGARVEPFDEVRLRGRVGDGQGAGAPAVVGGDALDHGVHLVAVRQRPGERLQHEDRAALAPYVPVGVLVEGARAAGAREHAGLAEGDEVLRRPDQVDAAGQGEAALAVAQRGDRFVDRDQRAGARGVVGDARALEVEEVRDAVGDDGIRGTGGEVHVGGRLLALHEFRVVGVADAHEDPGPGAREGARPVSGVLDRLPGEFQREPLLRVHALGFPRRDAEERRVEAVGVLDEAAPDAARAVGAALRLAEIALLGPAVGRYLGNQ